MAPEGGGGAAPRAGFRMPSVEPFFEHVYLPAMKWHPTPGERPFPLGAACCAGAFLGLGILNVYFAGQLDMPKDQEEFFPGQDKRAKFPTSKAHISAVLHSFRLIFGRAIISRNGLEA